ncbi:MAG: patatin family protein [Cellulosilyticum sp.]|nr:patatin family protein [Cellulosilyticum sp.]MEE1072906.1 patatin family protein [Cellulosilyticum sp.]
MTSKIGLIAEGGGMRGAYTAGILEVFLEHNIDFPYAIGVSAGANTLCSYLSKQNLRNKRLYTEWITDKRFINWRNLFTEGAYFGMHFLFNELPVHLDPFDFKAFKNNPATFKVGVTNCFTGQCEFMEPKLSPSLEDSDEILKASSSLPFMSKMVYLNGTPYLDGGISNSIPIDQAEKDGFTYNVVILTRNANYRKTYSKKMDIFAKHSLKRYPQLAKAIGQRAQMYNRTLDYLKKQEQEGKVFIFRPNQPLEVDRCEKDPAKLAKLYNQGYEEAVNQLPQLLNWMKSVSN